MPSKHMRDPVWIESRRYGDGGFGWKHYEKCGVKSINWYPVSDALVDMLGCVLGYVNLLLHSLVHGSPSKNLPEVGGNSLSLSTWGGTSAAPFGFV